MMWKAYESWKIIDFCDKGSKFVKFKNWKWKNQKFIDNYKNLHVVPFSPVIQIS